MEQQFANLIWENAPVQTRVLMQLCAEAFGWKRTTTYTMLKRLCDRGLFQNEQGQVTAQMSREEFGAVQGEQLLQQSFGGSLPQFLAAFTRRKKLSAQEREEIERLIQNYREE